MMRLNRFPGPSEISVIGRGGQVALPPSMASYRLGQRLYFSKTASGILMTSQPKRAWHGRLLSTRVKRSVRTLAKFGPRSCTQPRSTNR